MNKCPNCQAILPANEQECHACGLSISQEFAATRQKLPNDDEEEDRTPTRLQEKRNQKHFSGATPEAGRFIAGTILANRYRIIGLLGRGGMGEVYKAEDLELGQTVALKFLPASLAADKTALERFRSEVRTARQVAHPNVCRVFDIGEVKGSYYLSMEFIDGDDLSQLLRRIGRLPSDKAVDIARQLCYGLHAVHNAGILHRDLKPANVIIDGQGKARITDFGIAALEGELKGGGGAGIGTPAYMSPEQITGKEVTAKSDIYALGLVLYEIFTGKQAVQFDSIPELIEKHQTETPTTPSEVLAEINPLVERAILHCLEKNPADRPKNALQVALMLPGGNPLEAAIAAGETPSPEMIAASPKKGALRPPVALACLAAVVACFAFIVFFSGKIMYHEWIPLDKSPEALAERASQINNKLGYTVAPTDTSYRFGVDPSYVDYVKQANADAPDRFEKIRAGQPVALYFWYRTSPRHLAPTEGSRTDFSDPPIDVSGMTGLKTDVRGRLLEFRAVPPQVEEKASQPAAAAAATDWPALFAEAGLDIRNYREIEPTWTPPVFADERRAWEGAHIDHAEIPVRIEAAAYRGKPVYFQSIAPWDKPTRQEQVAFFGPADILVTIAFFSGLVAAVLAAYYNLKIGRGDTKGAFKLVLFIFSVITLAQLTGVEHVPALGGELWISFQIAGLSLVVAAMVGIFYIAVEPFVRRRWPELIISWNRLLAGDWRDPMVGRDVLVGGLLGLGHSAAIYLGFLLPKWLGMVNSPGGGLDTDTLLGVRGMAASFFFSLAMPILYSVVYLFLLVLFFALLRRKWLALAAFWTLIFSIHVLSFGTSQPWVFLITPVLTATIQTAVIARFGLVAFYSFFIFLSLSFSNAITSDLSKFYAGNTFFALVVIMGLAIYGFYTSLAGQQIFQGKLLADAD